MRPLVALLLAAACGRLGFDDTPRPDAAEQDAEVQAPPPKLIANAGATAEAIDTRLRVPVPPTTVGNLLVVSLTIHTDAAVTGIIDDAGNTYVSAGARASMGGTSSEIWYAEQRAPATFIDVATTKAGSFNAYTLEFAGVRAAPAKRNTACLQYPPTFVSAPITTTFPDELIVTVTMFAFPVFVSGMRPPFVGMPPLSGNATGYLVAREPGTYASTFDLESGEGQAAMTCASSVSFTR